MSLTTPGAYGSYLGCFGGVAVGLFLWSATSSLLWSILGGFAVAIFVTISAGILLGWLFNRSWKSRVEGPDGPDTRSRGS